MERLEIKPRKNWRKEIKEQGLVFNDTVKPDGTNASYWNENAVYKFTLDEVLYLEKVTEELHQMSIEAAKFLIEEQKKDKSIFKNLYIPNEAVEYAEESFQRGDKDIYGRFDLAYHGEGNVKMLEYNADTPTGLYEAAIIQWEWFQKKYPHADQWNSIHESLVSRWAGILADNQKDNLIHFAHSSLDKTNEDLMTTSYMRDTAQQAGWNTVGLDMSDIGYKDGKYYDLDMNEINNIFKLYPWEYMMFEDFGKNMCDMKPTGWYEPAWKMFLSTKILSAALWHIYPDHEYLLRSYIDHPDSMNNYVKKPLHGREGDGISLYMNNVNLTGDFSDEWGENGYVYQDFYPLPNFVDSEGNNNYPVLGTWVVGGDSVGVGIRESDGLFTDYYCRFVPNIIL